MGYQAPGGQFRRRRSDLRFSDEEAQAAAVGCAQAYREHLRDYSKINPLEVWYDRLDAETLIAMAPDEKIKKRRWWSWAMKIAQR